MKQRFTIALVFSLLATICLPLKAQVENSKYKQADSFRQLEEILPTPNAFRTASGAPGPSYWQQQADYIIHVELDDAKQRIIGKETITYTNNSPDTLEYLWLQIEPNSFAPDSDANLITTAPTLGPRTSFSQLRRIMARDTFDGSAEITAVTDVKGNDLPYTINKTMMRIDLKKSLKPNQTMSFKVAWNYKINDSKLVPARTGAEYFEEDKNYIYEIAHWYPRMVSYTDVNGWQHKQFVGRGEFTLEFGDYSVRITAPDDHIVAATGTLSNPEDVLTKAQRDRFKKARKAKAPTFVVTPEEAKKNESSKPKGKKTWHFEAKNVRDFAFASSRKFIWDAQGHNVGGNTVMAMSYYPNEAEPLWSKYSTHSIIHTLDIYSKFTFDYPYPIAISVNGPVYGMEYPMICFNGPRPEKDGTYTKRTKYGLISVIIHEVGHNYFPMIVNNDERQWTWMDEGLNSFLQYLAEQEWEENYPSWRGEPKKIVPYMTSTVQVPIMTNSESTIQFGNNAYGKPATALNILRETIMGRELFDFAFKQYARRWQFKRPMPADFFRTMEDASGVDLDWFWRGWFYSTAHTDISIENVNHYVIDTRNPDIEKNRQKDERNAQPKSISAERNEPLTKRVDTYPHLKDFYNDFDELNITEADRKSFERFANSLSDKDRKLLYSKQNFYIIDFKNLGGLVMPILLQMEFVDGTKQMVVLPAEIWRKNNQEVSKLLVTTKEIKSLQLDPQQRTADADEENNHFPRRMIKSRFQLFKDQKSKNEMQKANDAKKAAAKPEPKAEVKPKPAAKPQEKPEPKPKKKRSKK